MNTFISDVDGVLTDDRARVSKEAVELAARISLQSPFFYVTGRSAEWLSEHILPILSEFFAKREPFITALYAECGAVALYFDRRAPGLWRKERDASIKELDHVRDDLRKKVVLIDGVFFDESKEVMVSVEAEHKLREQAPQTVITGLAEAEALLKTTAASDPELEYVRTTYACDLVPRGLNKAHGAGRVIELLEEHAFVTSSTHAYLFGDSRSDLLLARPFKERGIAYTMHFVGEPFLSLATEVPPEKLRIHAKKHDQGTIQFLREFF